MVVMYVCNFDMLSGGMTSLALPNRQVLCLATSIIITVSPSCRTSVLFLYSANVALATAPGRCQLWNVNNVAIMIVQAFISWVETGSSSPSLSETSTKSSPHSFILNYIIHLVQTESRG